MSLPKLASLGEPNDIEAVFQLWVSRQVLAHHLYLLVGILEETIQSVLFNVVTDPNGLDIDAWNILLHCLDEGTQAEWVAAAVTYTGEQGC